MYQLPPPAGTVKTRSLVQRLIDIADARQQQHHAEAQLKPESDTAFKAVVLSPSHTWVASPSPARRSSWLTVPLSASIHVHATPAAAPGITRGRNKHTWANDRPPPERMSLISTAIIKPRTIGTSEKKMIR